MLKDPTKSSGADQLKRKLCIVCTGPAIDDYEIVILDLESDLKVLSNDCEQVDDSDPVVLTPIAKLDIDLLHIHTFCVLGSKLYMFDDGYLGVDDRFSVMTTDELKSAYAYDFSSSSSSSSSSGVVKLGCNNVLKLSDMWGPKACARAAAPIPDGNIIVVYSSMIQYDPCDKDNQIQRIDFEVYDVEHNKWEELPGLAEIVAEKYGLLGSNYTFDIHAFNFVTHSKILVLISSCLFSLDLDQKQRVWEFRDLDKIGEFGTDYGEEPCLLFVPRQLCVSPMAVFDTENRKSFSLPDLLFEDSSASESSAHITLLGGDGGEYEFARVYMGLSEQTKLPLIVVDLFKFNILSSRLGIRFVKSSEFVLGNRERESISGYDVFPITAGIDMSSTHEAPGIDKTSTHEAPGIDMSSTHEAPEL